MKLCGLKKRYGKSWYHLNITEIDSVILQKIVSWLGYNDADGTLMMDSGGFAVSRYKRWINAKYRVQDVKEFDKMNILQSSHGRICAVEVKKGESNDSPSMRRLLPFPSEGTGGDVLADSAYANRLNAKAIADTNRTPIMMPKKNSVIKGFGAYAMMLRSREEHTRTFYKKLAQRNNVESAFSAIKRRFDSFVRAIKKPNRAIELVSMTICYNMTF